MVLNIRLRAKPLLSRQEIRIMDMGAVGDVRRRTVVKKQVVGFRKTLEGEL